MPWGEDGSDSGHDPVLVDVYCGAVDPVAVGADDSTYFEIGGRLDGRPHHDS
jgi:hypothetical protein